MLWIEWQNLLGSRWKARVQKRAEHCQQVSEIMWSPVWSFRLMAKIHERGGRWKSCVGSYTLCTPRTYASPNSGKQKYGTDVDPGWLAMLVGFLPQGKTLVLKHVTCWHHYLLCIHPVLFPRILICSRVPPPFLRLYWHVVQVQVPVLVIVIVLVLVLSKTKKSCCWALQYTYGSHIPTINEKIIMIASHWP
jgi:hypothetical protein